MARAAATVEDLEAGDLPNVCAKTGEAAEGYATIEFTSTPSWTWILLLFGIFPFLIARHFSRVRVFGRVPMSDVPLRRARWFTWTHRILLLIGVPLTGVGFFTSPSVALIGLGWVLGSLLVMLAGWPLVWPTGQLSGDWVWLSFVHERFAEALHRWYDR